MNIEKVPQGNTWIPTVLMNIWSRWNYDFAGLCKQEVPRVISSNFLRLENGGAFHDGDLIVDELMRIIQVRKWVSGSGKEEILGQHHLSRHELSAIIKMSGGIGLSTSGLTLSVVTENAKLARHLYSPFSILRNQIGNCHHQRVISSRIGSYTVLQMKKVQDLLSDLHQPTLSLAWKQVLTRAILSDEEAGQPISVALS